MRHVHFDESHRIRNDGEITIKPELQCVIGESILLFGSYCAVLLQIAKPEIGHAIAMHTKFKNRPFDRIRTTLAYIYGVAFGTPDEIKRVSEIVNISHSEVIGDGYSADDPELQLWVAATIYYTAIRLYELVFTPLSADMAERVYQQYL